MNSGRPFDPGSTVRAEDHLPEPLPESPFPLFIQWFDAARAAGILPNPNAFSLATVDADGRPSVRTLLCKGIDPDAGFIEFFTNYNSRKGRALSANPRAAACFHWDALERQVRVEGLVVRSSAARSEEYFASRPWENRIGAWASEQSSPVVSRMEMASKVLATLARFGIDPLNPKPEVQIPRPPHWGGYQLHADRVELWVSGTGRVHDRAAWTRALASKGDSVQAGPWVSTRLQP
jgi:pyridoxamine 5'-phosphate oxidase